MDKYAGYVVITYAVTLLILVGYLGWIWLRLRHKDDIEGDSEGDGL